MTRLFPGCGLAASEVPRGECGLRAGGRRVSDHSSEPGKSRAFESFCLRLRYRGRTPPHYKPFQVCSVGCAEANGPHHSSGRRGGGTMSCENAGGAFRTQRIGPQLFFKRRVCVRSLKSPTGTSLLN